MGHEPTHAWRYLSKCLHVDTNLFYPPRDRRLYRGVADKAKAICWGTGDDDPECPVRRECLTYALMLDDPHGIWGGLSHRERSHLKRKFETLQPRTSFTQWVMEQDGGVKAKQFTKQVPRYEESEYEARRAS